MALVIKKIVDLSHLGDEYKGIELVFRSIPANDLTGIEKKRKSLEKSENKKSESFDLDKLVPFFQEVLEKYFVGGKQGEENIVKEDLGQLTADAMIECFSILVGNKIDPKVSSESTNTSTTTQDETEKLKNTNTEDSST